MACSREEDHRAATKETPRPNQRAKLIVDMATSEVPNDTEQVLAALREKEQPAGRAKSAKARPASQTAERRSEVASRAAAVRWGT